MVLQLTCPDKSKKNSGYLYICFAKKTNFAA